MSVKGRKRFKFLFGAAMATLSLSAFAPAMAQPVVLIGGTVIDATGRAPIADAVILLDGGKIQAVGRAGKVRVPADARTIDATGKYILPGLIDANVHLFIDAEPEVILKYRDRLQDLITEAAQVTLRNGVTTVFDTWGPAADLAAVRDRINAGTVQGSTIFIAGNIIGFDGPLSSDFFDASKQFGKAFSDEINEQWVHGTGRKLLYGTPEMVRDTLSAYMAKTSVDFVKYASSGHVNEQFIAFSPAAQDMIVKTVHGSGRRVAVHTTSVESLRLAIEAGADIAVHCTYTAGVAIPQSTVVEMKRYGTVCGTGMSTAKSLAYERLHGREGPEAVEAQISNTKALYKAGVVLAMATDAGLFAPTAYDGEMAAMLNAPDMGTQLENAQLLWLKGAIEHGLTPMAALQSATVNVARGYGMADRVGTLEAGKQADLLVLNANPLDDPDNYRQIALVIKGGVVVDRDRLPLAKIFTGVKRDQPAQ